jgi:hypothetical protein
MKKIITLEGNILKKLKPFLLNVLKAKEVGVVNNNIDSECYTYEINHNHKKTELIVVIKEDALFGDTTTVSTSGEIIKQINDFMEMNHE